MKKIILTSPTHDEDTQFLSAWISDVADYIDGLHNRSVVRLNGEHATQENLTQSIIDHDPRMIMFNGHGNSLMIGGHNDLPLVSSQDESVQNFSGRIIHALVCSAGHTLGQELVDSGADAFVGYKDLFYYWQAGNTTDDSDAKLFLEPALHVSKALSDGVSVGDAFKQSQKMYAKNLKAALSSFGDSEVSQKLEWNIKHHIAKGNLAATI